MGETRLKKDFLAEITRQEEIYKNALDRLVALRVEWEMHKLSANEPSPDWLRPEYLKIRTVTQAVLNALEHNRLNGLKLHEFEPYLRSVNLPFHRPTVSATLGRLKRETRVIRERGGRWKLHTYANRPKEDA